MDYHGYQLYLEQILTQWSGKPKEGAYQIMRKYGLPNEATLSELKWYNNGLWKRKIVSREPVPHNFPTPHVDFLEQIIDYRVPVDKFDEIAKFDGSAYLDRTRGEASAKCHSEAMNFLTLNLVNDIVTGQRDVENARMFYAETAKKLKELNISSPYTEQFLFPPQKNTTDPDKALF